MLNEYAVVDGEEGLNAGAGGGIEFGEGASLDSSGEYHGDDGSGFQSEEDVSVEGTDSLILRQHFVLGFFEQTGRYVSRYGGDSSSPSEIWIHSLTLKQYRCIERRTSRSTFHAGPTQSFKAAMRYIERYEDGRMKRQEKYSFRMAKYYQVGNMFILVRKPR